MRDGEDPMTLPCPYCGVDVQIEMTQLGRTEVIGPAGSAVHQATQQIIAGATHASPVCGSFDFADWFLMSPRGDAQGLRQATPQERARGSRSTLSTAGVAQRFPRVWSARARRATTGCLSPAGGSLQRAGPNREGGSPSAAACPRDLVPRAYHAFRTRARMKTVRSHRRAMPSCYRAFLGVCSARGTVLCRCVRTSTPVNNALFACC